MQSKPISEATYQRKNINRGQFNQEIYSNSRLGFEGVNQPQVKFISEPYKSFSSQNSAQLRGHALGKQPNAPGYVDSSSRQSNFNNFGNSLYRTQSGNSLARDFGFSSEKVHAKPMKVNFVNIKSGVSYNIPNYANIGVVAQKRLQFGRNQIQGKLFEVHRVMPVHVPNVSLISSIQKDENDSINKNQKNFNNYHNQDQPSQSYEYEFNQQQEQEQENNKDSQLLFSSSPIGQLNKNILSKNYDETIAFQHEKPLLQQITKNLKSQSKLLTHVPFEILQNLYEKNEHFIKEHRKELQNLFEKVKQLRQKYETVNYEMVNSDQLQRQMQVESLACLIRKMLNQFTQAFQINQRQFKQGLQNWSEGFIQKKAQQKMQSNNPIKQEYSSKVILQGSRHKNQIIDSYQSSKSVQSAVSYQNLQKQYDSYAKNRERYIEQLMKKYEERTKVLQNQIKQKQYIIQSQRDKFNGVLRKQESQLEMIRIHMGGGSEKSRSRFQESKKGDIYIEDFENKDIRKIGQLQSQNEKLKQEVQHFKQESEKLKRESEVKSKREKQFSTYRMSPVQVSNKEDKKNKNEENKIDEDIEIQNLKKQNLEKDELIKNLNEKIKRTEWQTLDLSQQVQVKGNQLQNIQKMYESLKDQVAFAKDKMESLKVKIEEYEQMIEILKRKKLQAEQIHRKSLGSISNVSRVQNLKSRKVFEQKIIYDLKTENQTLKQKLRANAGVIGNVRITKDSMNRNQSLQNLRNYSNSVKQDTKTKTKTENETFERQMFENKIKTLEARVQELLQVSKNLKAHLEEALLSKSQSETLNFFKGQFEQSEARNKILQAKLRYYLNDENIRIVVSSSSKNLLKSSSKILKQEESKQRQDLKRQLAIKELQGKIQALSREKNQVQFFRNEAQHYKNEYLRIKDTLRNQKKTRIMQEFQHSASSRQFQRPSQQDILLKQNRKLVFIVQEQQNEISNKNIEIVSLKEQIHKIMSRKNKDQ